MCHPEREKRNRAQRRNVTLAQADCHRVTCGPVTLRQDVKIDERKSQTATLADRRRVGKWQRVLWQTIDNYFP